MLFFVIKIIFHNKRFKNDNVVMWSLCE